MADYSKNEVLKETPSIGGYTESSLVNIKIPVAVAVTGNGNLIIAENYYDSVLEEDSVDPPALSFASTVYGLTSTDSPQAVTVENAGNAVLSFPVLSSGNNPSIATNFVLSGSGGSPCPMVSAGASTAGTLTARDSCTLSVNFTPLAVGALSGSLVLTDDNLNASAPTYASQSISLSGAGTQVTPTIVWAAPASIIYGTNLSGILNAAAQSGSTTIPGTFVYTATISGGTAAAVTAATVLAAGSYTMNTTFTPTNATDSMGGTGSISLTVGKSAPVVSLVSAANPAFVSSTIAFTATVSSSVGPPTGTMAFYDGTTLLGSGNVIAGSVTYSATALVGGPHSITAVYSGDSNFATVTSAAVVETIQDFTIAVSSSGSSSATAAPGGQAAYSLTVTPLDGSTLPGAVTLAVSGLPSGATATFSPATVPAASGSTNVTLSLNLSSQAAAKPSRMPFDRGTLAVALGLIVLPFAGRWRRGIKGYLSVRCLQLLV